MLSLNVYLRNSRTLAHIIGAGEKALSVRLHVDRRDRSVDGVRLAHGYSYRQCLARHCQGLVSAWECSSLMGS
jgi:hypothetical protein